MLQATETGKNEKEEPADETKIQKHCSCLFSLAGINKDSNMGRNNYFDKTAARLIRILGPLLIRNPALRAWSRIS